MSGCVWEALPLQASGRHLPILMSNAAWDRPSGNRCSPGMACREDHSSVFQICFFSSYAADLCELLPGVVSFAFLGQRYVWGLLAGPFCDWVDARTCAWWLQERLTGSNLQEDGTYCKRRSGNSTSNGFAGFHKGQLRALQANGGVFGGKIFTTLVLAMPGSAGSDLLFAHTQPVLHFPTGWYWTGDYRHCPIDLHLCKLSAESNGLAIECQHVLPPLPLFVDLSRI